MELLKSGIEARALCTPLKLKTARAWRTGTGGREIDKLLGAAEPADSHFPEDWIASTVRARNIGREAYAEEGLSYLDTYEDLTLKEVIEAYPNEALGQKHVQQIGKAPGVLAKIIDPAERATLQVHPDKETARRLFHSPFGKTESWHVLSVRQDTDAAPGVYLGFKKGVTRERWKQVFDAQDIPAMLDCLHYFPVKPKDTFIIRAGVPHAVSKGFLFLEMQEPTDFTIRTERMTVSGFPIDDQLCHQGLGFEQMFDCFHYDGLSEPEAAAAFRVPARTVAQSAASTHTEVVGYAQTDCFRLHRYEINTQATLEAASVCSALFVFSGNGTLLCGGMEQPIRPGDQFFLSASCGPVTLRTDGAPLLAFRSFGPRLV